MRPPRNGGAAPAPLAGIWTNVDGQQMYSRVSTAFVPAGRLPVVMVHGLGMSSRYLQRAAAVLGADYRVYAPDLPGFGRSERPRRVLDVPELADRLNAWMEAMDLERAVWIANSLGCQIVVDLAVRYSQRVACAVLQGPTPDPSDRSMSGYSVRLLADAFREPPSLLWIAALDYLLTGPRRYLQTFRYLLDDPIEDKLPRVAAPTLIVRGARDPIVPEDWARQAARLLPQGRLVQVERAAHAALYSHPAEFGRIVRQFVTGVGHARPPEREVQI